MAGVEAQDEAYAADGSKLPDIDSLDVSDFVLGRTSESPRKEIPLTLGQHQPGGSGGGLIVGPFKLLRGKQMPAHFNGPEYPNGTRPAPISIDCDAGCLFDIINDPTEHHDISREYPDILANLTLRFDQLAQTAYQSTYIEGSMNCSEPRVLEMLQGGFWTPWTDAHAYP